MACRKYQKSSIRMLNPATQTVAVNNTVVYTQTTESTGASVSGNLAAGTVTLAKPGIYSVLVNCNLTTGTTAGTIVTQLMANGVAVPGALNTVTATTDSTTVGFTIPYRLEVPASCCCVDNSIVLSVVNTGTVAGAYNTAAITVIKEA